MIDIEKTRAAVAQTMLEWPDTTRMDPVRALIDLLDNTLDKLEALRKPVAPCRFDVAAAREELAQIDERWASVPEARLAGTRDMLDRALAAIDAGWPEPAAITDAVVEEAANVAYQAWDGEHIDMPHDMADAARAVLEYAASLGGVAPAPVVDTSRRMTIPMRHPLAGKCAADRLTDYRCAAIPALVAAARQEWRGAEHYPAIGRAAEDIAHAMLAAERTPARG